MSWELATIALILLGFAAVSGRVEGTSLTAAMVFTTAGFAVGVDALGLVDPEATGEFVRVLAEATLAVVLFSDASRIDLRALREEVSVPARLLGIGLPLTILAGFLAAVLVFDGLAWPEALVLAVVLAPTDAALGHAVVTYRRLPSKVRQSLNVEAGLNDGLCVPLLFVAVAITEATEARTPWRDAFRLVAEGIGYGVIGGAIAGGAAASLIVVAGRYRLISAPWVQVVPLAGAGLAVGVAGAIGGSGFIAAFVGGGVFGAIRRRRGGEVGYLNEEVGGLLAAVTFIVFGAVLLGPALGETTWPVLIYVVLSLTVVRMIPVAVALLGTGARLPTVGFLGWFGPRGLASIVLALLLLEEGVQGNDDLILTAAFVAVAVSVFAHGITAAPLSRRYAGWVGAHTGLTDESVETREAHGVPWRRWWHDGHFRIARDHEHSQSDRPGPTSRG